MFKKKDIAIAVALAMTVSQPVLGQGAPESGQLAVPVPASSGTAASGSAASGSAAAVQQVQAPAAGGAAAAGTIAGVPIATAVAVRC